MEHPGALAAAAVTEPPVEARLIRFDRVRDLLVATALPPVPDVYDLLWRYAGGDDFALSQAVAAAIAAGTLDLAAVAALRATHCGAVAAGDISALVAAAHAQAVRITGHLRDSRSDLNEYGRTIADGDATLNGADAPRTPAALAALIDRLGRATGAMLIVNRRLEAELTIAADEAGSLRDKLHCAERAAVTDPLTGVLNRRGVLAVLAGLRATGAPLSVAMIDIDHFKRVNDRWGHAIGDEILRYVARHLADGVAAAGSTNAVGRVGGEEFVAVLPGSQTAATALIDGLRARLAGQLIRRDCDGVNLGRVSFSAGVALDLADEEIDAVLARADAALYTAKRLGRDRVIPDR